jgi:hypothetical protein
MHDPAPENESSNRIVVHVLSQNGTSLSECSGQARYAYGNSSWIEEVQPGVVDFEFSHCYLVDIVFKCSENTGNLAGFYSLVRQTALMDENFRPLFVCVLAAMAVS